MKFRNVVVVTTHRWTSLAALCFWLLQAVTGVFAVFHWEIDDAILAGAHRPTDFSAIERRLAAVAAGSGQRVGSMWTSASGTNRFDVYLDDRVVRIDGAGNILRTRPDGQRFANGGFVGTLVVIHQSLLAGQRGKWIVGISGVLLLSNLILGIVAAWPRSGQWGRAIRPLTSGARVARLYSWHRAIGLWLAFPALFLVAAGVLLAFEGFTERVLGAPAVESPSEPATAPQRVGMAAAIETALARYPGAEVSGIGFPSADDATWTITVRQRGERRRAYGKTRLFISAIDGRIVTDFNAVTAAPSRRFVNFLFPFHTGEMGGTPGRIVIAAIGVWLIAMIFLGINLWSTRRRVSTPRDRADVDLGPSRSTYQ